MAQNPYLQNRVQNRVQNFSLQFRVYNEYGGLDIPVKLCIASVLSRQIAILIAGPNLALQPMGAKRSFRCHLLNIAPIYKQ